MNQLQQEELRILLEFNRICVKHNITYSLGYGTLLGAIRHNGFIPWDDDVDVIMLRDEYNKFLSVVKNELLSDFTYVDHDIEDKYYYAFAKIRSNSVELREKSVDYLSIHQGVWIDIFPYDAIPNDKNAALKQKNLIKKYHNLFVAFVFTYLSDSDTGIKRVIKKILETFNRKTKNLSSTRNKWFDKQHQAIIQYNHEKDFNCNCLAPNFTEHEYHSSILSKDALLDVILHDFEGTPLPIIASYHEHLSAIYGDYMTPPPVNEQVSNHDTIV